LRGLLERYMTMLKNIIILIVSILLISSNYYWYTKSTSEIITEKIEGKYKLDVKQRDIVIDELISIMTIQNLGNSQELMLEIFKQHPENEKYGKFYNIEESTIEFGTTLKFEFENKKLVKIYW